jgi:hypothetical protein
MRTTIAFVVYLLAALYAWVMLASLAPIVMLLLYIPIEEFSQHPGVLFWIVFPLLNAVFNAVIAYSFFAMKNWSRYIAIAYNSLWIGYILLAFVAGVKIGDIHLNGPTIGLFLVITALLLIIAFCLRDDVRTMMKYDNVSAASQA